MGSVQANQEISHAPLAEMGGERFPLISLDEQSLVLGNYRHPARRGDYRRITLRFSPTLPGAVNLLAVVTGANRATGQLSCRLEQVDPDSLVVLRQLASDPAPADPLPQGQGGPSTRLASSLRKGAEQLGPLVPAAGALGGLVLAGGVALLALRSVAASLATIRIENGVIAAPPGPVVAAVEPVVAREQGLLDQLYGREGSAVVPGQPLFSTRQDPRLELDLLDRQAARDLNALDARLRDTQGQLDGLAERIALDRQEVRQLPARANAAQIHTLQQQIQVARRLEQRRLALLRQGGISQDSYDGSLDRLLELQARQQLLLRQSRADQGRRERIGVLLSLEQGQRRRLEALRGERQRLQAGIEQRRALRRQHPLPGDGLSTPVADRVLYRASAAGMILRQLKSAGESIRPNEAVFLLQKQQLPPLIKAQVREQELPALAMGSEAIAEIPALRQHYPVRLVSLAPPQGGSRDLHFEFVALQANDQRQLTVLQGQAARLFLPNRRNWLERLRSQLQLGWGNGNPFGSVLP